MRLVVQRVKSASVEVDDNKIAEIEAGLLVYLGIGADDEQSDINYLVDKILDLRIFSNEGKMDLSATDVAADLLIVPQFTLYGSCHEGRRPDFSQAAGINEARELYEKFIATLKNQTELKVATGRFQAYMNVESINDGPVTMLIESKKRF